MLFVHNILNGFFGERSLILSSKDVKSYLSNSTNLKVYVIEVFDNISNKSTKYTISDFLKLIESEEVNGVVHIDKNTKDFKRGSVLIFCYNVYAHKIKSYFYDYFSIEPTSISIVEPLLVSIYCVEHRSTFLKYCKNGTNNMSNIKYQKSLINDLVIKLMSEYEYYSIWQILYRSLILQDSDYTNTVIIDKDNNKILVRLYEYTKKSFWKKTYYVKIYSDKVLELTCRGNLNTFLSKIALDLL